jgi:hypothetical protein
MHNISQQGIVVSGETHHELPVSIEQTRAWIQQLRFDIEDIELQLGDRNRTAPDGARLSGEDYHQWRFSAKRALGVKKRQVIELKMLAAQYEQQQRMAEHHIDLDDPYVVIAALVQTTRTLIKNTSLPISDEVRVALEAGEQWCNRMPMTPSANP